MPLAKLKLTASATYVGERFDDDREDDLRDNTELFLRADNVLDADYQEIKDFNTPGRSAYLGLRARF